MCLILRDSFSDTLMQVFLSQSIATSTRIHWFFCLVYHNSSKGSVTTQGVLHKILYGEAPPGEVQPLPFIFDRKWDIFVYLY